MNGARFPNLPHSLITLWPTRHPPFQKHAGVQNSGDLSRFNSAAENTETVETARPSRFSGFNDDCGQRHVRRRPASASEEPLVPGQYAVLLVDSGRRLAWIHLGEANEMVKLGEKSPCATIRQFEIIPAMPMDRNCAMAKERMPIGKTVF
jgi:hypothetical protein